MTNQWNASLYSNAFSFIPQLGSGLIDLLNLSTSDTVLDIGCGTGELTNQLSTHCKSVIAIDLSATMIAQAKVTFPHIDFRIGSALNFQIESPVDAVLSNATLHWVKPPELAIQTIYSALKPSGKFAAEFGGKQNVQTILDGIYNALEKMGKQELWKDYWYFPSLGEYTTLLESAGFRVEQAFHFNRPTPMNDPENGLKNWLRMFVLPHTEVVNKANESEFLNDVETYCRPYLFKDGDWVLDYVRLRVLAKK